MRLISRRRPAGKPQVPEVLAPPGDYALPVEPTVLRLSRERLLLDSPWDMEAPSLSHVWPGNASTSTWIRARWPIDFATGRWVVPTDLHIGHVIEIGTWIGAQWHAIYTWVADVRDERFVLVPAPTASDAASMARGAVDVWRANELAAVEHAWRQRIDSAKRFR